MPAPVSVPAVRRRPLPHSTAPGILLSALLAGLGCSSSGSAREGAGARGRGGAGGASAPDVVVGTFAVRLQLPDGDTPGTTQLQGEIFDGPPLPEQFWETTDEQRGCSLQEPVNPFCNPECESGQRCVTPGECVAEPAKLSVGTVTVTGVATESGDSLILEPMGRDAVYSGYTNSYPPFAEGDELRLEATGDVIDPFRIDAVAIGPLEVAPGEVRLEPGQPATVTWTPPEQADATRISVVFHPSVRDRNAIWLPSGDQTGA